MNNPDAHYPINAPKYFPQQCPVCLHDIELKPVYKEFGTNGQLWVFKCPRYQCQAVFSVLHTEHKTVQFPGDNQSLMNQDELRAISERFVTTYNQAIKAERLKMTELYGEGYRKAVEYLVKDFLIKFGNLSKSEKQISKMHLGDAVNKLPDARLVNLAKASTWLGNDQSHVLQKHPEYGVEDLKKFIEALAAFSIYTMRAKQAEEFVNSDD
ncbi:hypothetical protein [Limosilactobacillus difficilis]|uniref:hypothetical protein n=1 Tax=Limosilactobacillus difficilis TaxID=2991838 RepID=UPI0024BB0AB3|nr:hypothetical protein [Limosilactobacillus difficilis]